MENYNERTKLAIDLAKIAGNEIKRNMMKIYIQKEKD